MKTIVTAAITILLVTAAVPAKAAAESVLMQCGASSGKGYWFDGEGWESDGISSGRILLIGDAGGVEGEFDIRMIDAFSPVHGQFSYRADGATVLQVSAGNGLSSFIAAHPNYTEQFTFNSNRREVVWTSHKVATSIPKVGIYYAECD